MNIPYSKKELYKDNIQLRKELDRAYASNIELKLLYDQLHEEIEEVNKTIREYTDANHCI